MSKVKTFSSIDAGVKAEGYVTEEFMREYTAAMLSPFIQKIYKHEYMIQILLEWLAGDFAVRDANGVEIGRVDFDLAGFSAYSERRKKEIESGEQN